jgi:hypothetical protein
MASFYPAAAASRLGRTSQLNWAGSGTLVTTPMGPETFHVRILSQIAGFVAIDNLGTVVSSAGGGALIAAQTAAGDFFKCVPGQLVSFSSSSTSSGSLTVTEMS